VLKRDVKLQLTNYLFELIKLVIFRLDYSDYSYASAD